ncbi:ADP-glyceromanno-heptose 6-epimerase [Bauldia sp.]|uniref:ADP-glyceromanno-heptose 6-epimerase n=1 Tax=Bauldia sp. TaxID=2575872 RepID=UPI003BADA62F
MFIVTGAAGFIGSNLIHALNDRGHSDVIAVDDLTDGHKFENLVGSQIADFIDARDFRQRILDGADFGKVAAVFHQGACSDTTEWDGRYMLDTNFTVSKELFGWCQDHAVPLIYASSAAVYGASTDFREDTPDLRPLNVYGWSKLLFDQWVARQGSSLPGKVVGLRYFNVYGPRESHKGRMASVVHHFSRQIEADGQVKVFGASHGFDDGEHRRDFVFVGDAVKVNLWAYQSPEASGVYNVGTGTGRTFNDLARAVIAFHGRGAITYIPFPADLNDAYQAVTTADIDRLRGAGYDEPFAAIEEGVPATLGTNTNGA